MISTTQKYFKRVIDERLLFWLGIACVSAISMFVALSIVNLQQKEAFAQSSGSITGYAWSDTIGWISMNGSGYSLSVSGTGVVTGYAWSDNIGWVSANSSDLSGCPSSPCSASIDSSGGLQGWLRALSNGGGWDGFISLSGSNYGPVRQSSGAFSGYAWGDMVVGWLDFSYASTDYVADPTAEVKVRKVGEIDWQDSLTILPTDEIEVGWNQAGSANTVSCESTPPTNNFSTGSAVSGIDSDVDEPIGNTSNNYGVVCYSSSGVQKYDSASVTTTGGVGARFIICPGESKMPDFVRRGNSEKVCFELGTNNPEMCSLKTGTINAQSPLTGITSHTQIISGEVDFMLECVGGDSDTLRVRSLGELQET